jgi:hypothetical protein
MHPIHKDKQVQSEKDGKIFSKKMGSKSKEE